MAMEIRGTGAVFGKVVTDGLASEWMKMNDTYQLAGQTVRRIGFGAMQLPGPGVLGPPKDRDQALRVLRRSIELGVNHIDTAQFYGPDVANDLIREALHPYPSELALVSKVGARRSAQGDWLPAQTPAKSIAITFCEATKVSTISSTTSSGTPLVGFEKRMTNILV